jgi:solute carrier family 25 protein 39/40
LSPTLVLALPTTVIYFVAYEQFRVRLKDFYLRGKNRNVDIPMWIPLVSGGSARVLAVTIVNPLELVRTKMQSEKMSYYEVGQGFRAMVKSEGVRGLWKGYFPTILRDVPFSAIYWATYETIKKQFNEKNPPIWFTFCAGAAAGTTAAFCTIPFDVVKTHQQIEFGEKLMAHTNNIKTSGTFQTLAKIFHDNGIKGLFAGLAPRLIKVAPACAIMIATFEYGKKFFFSYNMTHYAAKNSGFVIPSEYAYMSKQYGHQEKVDRTL